MPFNNLESKHFTPDEETTIFDILTALEAALGGKMKNLTSRERLQYGSVKEHNKLFVNKIKEYNDTQPQLSSPDVDWEEFNNDYNSRSFLEAVLMRLEKLQTGTNNAKILHDWDNYKAGLTDYGYARYKKTTMATGYETKASELSQFFLNRGKHGSATAKNTDALSENNTLKEDTES